MIPHHTEITNRTQHLRRRRSEFEAIVSSSMLPLADLEPSSLAGQTQCLIHQLSGWAQGHALRSPLTSIIERQPSGDQCRPGYFLFWSKAGIPNARKRRLQLLKVRLRCRVGARLQRRGRQVPRQLRIEVRGGRIRDSRVRLSPEPFRRPDSIAYSSARTPRQHQAVADTQSPCRRTQCSSGRRARPAPRHRARPCRTRSRRTVRTPCPLCPA